MVMFRYSSAAACMIIFLMSDYVIAAKSSHNRQWFQPIPIEDYALGAEVKAEFERAKKLTEEGREDLALVSWADFLRRYPRHSLSDDAQFMVATIYFNRQRYDDAAIELQKVLAYTGMGADHHARAALRLGEVWMRLGRQDYARIEWQAIARRFPGSSESKMAEDYLHGLANRSQSLPGSTTEEHKP